MKDTALLMNVGGSPGVQDEPNNTYREFGSHLSSLDVLRGTKTEYSTLPPNNLEPETKHINSEDAYAAEILSKMHTSPVAMNNLHSWQQHRNICPTHSSKLLVHVPSPAKRRRLDVQWWKEVTVDICHQIFLYFDGNIQKELNTDDICKHFIICLESLEFILSVLSDLDLVLATNTTTGTRNIGGNARVTFTWKGRNKSKIFNRLAKFNTSKLKTVKDSGLGDIDSITGHLLCLILEDCETPLLTESVESAFLHPSSTSNLAKAELFIATNVLQALNIINYTGLSYIWTMQSNSESLLRESQSLATPVGPHSSQKTTRNGIESKNQSGSKSSKPPTRHRASCHRCGNMRKKVVRCPNCPQIYCRVCSEMMKEEHGEDVFDNGCPKCKQLCCCGPNRSTNCKHKYHCYRKCPTMKAGKAATVTYHKAKFTPPVASSPNFMFTQAPSPSQIYMV